MIFLFFLINIIGPTLVVPMLILMGIIIFLTLTTFRKEITSDKVYLYTNKMVLIQPHPILSWIDQKTTIYYSDIVTIFKQDTNKLSVLFRDEKKILKNNMKIIKYRMIDGRGIKELNDIYEIIFQKADIKHVEGKFPRNIDKDRKH